MAASRVQVRGLLELSSRQNQTLEPVNMFVRQLLGPLLRDRGPVTKSAVSEDDRTVTSGGETGRFATGQATCARLSVGKGFSLLCRTDPVAISHSATAVANIARVTNGRLFQS